jgi:anthranilate synthase/aminodeoxychorismate synthase-like glutamine amidotransferase
MPEVIEFYCQSIPILGICLGMQAIAFLYGAEIVKCRNPFHGKTSEVFHDSRTLFRGIPQGFRAMRYHSLIIERKELNSEIEVSAWTNDGIIMGLRHKSLPLEGVQFHPESILTESGDNIIRNWLKQ